MIGRTVGHYRILERLGGGGMGVVYKAEDTALHRTVALKFLPSELTCDDDAKQRFLIEARAAAKLDHPNICNIHEIAESDDGHTFIAMAHYEGESLATRIRRGPLPVEDAAKIAIEIARGLGAAHEAGIVHRDIKPANIMLTSKGEVKIVDFGVAKLAGVTMTRSKASPGTLAYMAPEQIRGEAISPATDLWALGVVFYEMLTGSRPFRGDYEQAVAYAILNEPPAPFDQTLPTRPPALDAVLAKALTKEPSKRYQSAEELIEGLETVTGGRATIAADQIKHRSVRQIALVASLFVVVAAALGTWIWNARDAGTDAASPDNTTMTGTTNAPPANSLEPKRVVVAVFENRTGDPSLDPIGRFASDLITDGLARLEIDVMPSSYGADAVAEATKPGDSTTSDPAILLAESTGSGLLVRGEYYLKDEILSIHAKIIDTATRKIVVALDPSEGPRTNPNEAVEIVRDRVRDTLGARLLGRDFVGTIASYEAKAPRYDAHAEMLLATDAAGAGDAASVITHARRAIELDPEYVQPYLFLAWWLSFTGEHEEAFAVLSRAETKRGNLSTNGRLDFDAVAASFRHQPEQAVAAARELARRSPGDIVARIGLIEYLVQANRPKEAVELLTAPGRWDIVIRPDKPHLGGLGHFMVLTSSLAVLDDHERQLTEARRARTTYPAELLPLILEARALAALGRFDEMNRVIDEGLALPGSLASGGLIILNAALVLRAHGYLEQSRLLLERGKSWTESLSPEAQSGQSMLIAEMDYNAGDWAEASTRFEAIAKKNVGTAQDQWPLGRLGEIAAARGDREEAMRISTQLSRHSSPYDFGQVSYRRALIASRLGDRDDAVRLLRSAISEGLVFHMAPLRGQLDDEPSLDSLRGYPPYEELVRPKG